MTSASTPAPRLQMIDISKSFGGVRALEGVSLAADAGEVHSLCGENGAGKSTLMKILCGAIVDYEGQIQVDGKPVKFAGPRDAEDAGIRIIHQELNLVPDLSVTAEHLPRPREDPRPRLSRRTGDGAARRGAFSGARHADLRPGPGSATCGSATSRLFEIAKALAFKASIVIMDEPTSALSDAEVARLFRVIGDLKAAGTTILYISHKMNEVFTPVRRRDRPPRRQVRGDKSKRRDVPRAGGPLDGRPRDRRDAPGTPPLDRPDDARRHPSPPSPARPAPVVPH